MLHIENQKFRAIQFGWLFLFASHLQVKSLKNYGLKNRSFLWL
jgi:hypothetical protein